MMNHPSSSPPLLLFLLLTIFFLNNPSSHAIESQITITPSNPTYTLIHTQKITNAAWSPPWFSNASPFTITSDIPVSLLRYGDRSVEGGNDIVAGNEVTVYVSTDCVVDGGGGSDVVTVEEVAGGDSNGEVAGLIITKRDGDEYDDDRLLEDSLFRASWNVSYPWCDPPKPEPKPKPSSRVAPNDMVTLKWPSSDGADDDVTASSSGKNCTYLAEILYDGCYRKLSTTAPIVAITNVTLSHISSAPVNDDPRRPCTFRHEAFLDLAAVETTQEMPVDTTSFDRRHCMRIAPGRPYFDSRGGGMMEPMMADVVVSEGGESSSSPWSTTAAAVAMTPTIVTSNSSSSSRRIDTVTSPTASSTTPSSSSSAASWLQQARGEHASIASFAKLTLSLLSLNAPPSLVRDALRAAWDEVDHALSSFHHASALMGKIVSPGPLPPSVHRFDDDLKELVRGVWREGCVDETMAALIAARDAATMDGEERRTMMRIAADESRHAGLAWRMVRWACRVDDERCREGLGMEERSGGGGLGSLGGGRGDDDVRREWERIYRGLIRVVVNDGDDGETDDDEERCRGTDGSIGEDGGDDGQVSLLRSDMGSERMMEVVREDIIRRVICHRD